MALTFIGSPTWSVSVGSGFFTFESLNGTGALAIGNDVLVFFYSATQEAASYFSVTDNADNPYRVFYLGTGGGFSYYVAISPSIANVPTTLNIAWSGAGTVSNGEIEVWNSAGYLTTTLDVLGSNSNVGSTLTISPRTFGDVVFSWFVANGTFSGYPSNWIEGISDVNSIYSAGIINEGSGPTPIPWVGSGNNMVVAIAFYPSVSFGGVSNLIMRPSFGRGPRW